MTAGIAHDFNNHLTVISSNVEMVKRRLGPDNARLNRHVDAAMQGVQRAAVLTGRLLSFARQPVAEPEAVDVGRLLGRLSDLLRRTLGEAVTLDLRLADDQWFVWADVNLMENALLSLAVNARDRVPHGGVLRVAVSHVRLDEVFAAAHSGVLPGDYVSISLSDPACGPVTSVTEWHEADDLAMAGLSMARGVVRQAGGCLMRGGPIDGPPALRLYLPRYRPPLPSAAARRPPTDGRQRILVVEDDPNVRRACVETLRDLEYDVLDAPDAMEAFRLIADNGGVDLLFTDIGLPNGVSGRALADAARNVDPGIRVLFSTGYPANEVEARGEVTLLPKPFTQAQLASKVRQVMQAHAPVGRAETVQS